MEYTIESNEKILGGALVIKGTRVPVSRILYQIASGRNIEDIVKADYPFLSVSKIKNVLKELAQKIEDIDWV